MKHVQLALSELTDDTLAAATDRRQPQEVRR
jgi:hypothetical protein